ncbi:hypothetical protein NESM_000587900 [Novymonas esmeraldas]|uniref:Cyclic nucleotide-binding domain-containing protein n=1 Tax=Novymonas esmeraldas TaxID=1808958 RepID=A0AAW0ESW2_9TRYP
MSRVAAVAGATVAEQVAALPPLSQLLGIAPPPPSSALEQEGDAGGGGRRRRRQLQQQKQKQQQRGNASVAPLPPSSSPSSPAATAAAATATPPPTPSDGCAGGVREWRRVQQSLQLPITYRAEEDIRLTLRLLRSLPLFSALLDNDLLILAETMAVMEVPGPGTVLMRKPVVDPTAAMPSGLMAAATASSAAHAATPPPLSLEVSMAPPLLDEEEDAQERPACVWTMPAAHLFQRFRAQMQRGEPPSLPPECAPRARHSGAAAGVSLPPLTTDASTRRGARRSQPTVAAGAAALTPAADPASGNSAATPLFSLGTGGAADAAGDDGDVDEEAFALVLLGGHCHLEWPRQRGPTEDAADTLLWQRYGLQPGDSMGYSLLWRALPPAARYVTTETCTLLLVSAEGRPPEVVARLRRVCRRVNDGVLRAQRNFLAHDLRVRLFDSGTDAAVVADGAVPQETAGTGVVVAAATADADADSTAAAATPPMAQLLETAARSLIPIRAPSHAVLLREGLAPVSECAIYFLLDGGLSVTRRVWSADQQRLVAERAQLVRALTPPTGICPPMAPLPATDSMEVTQLRPGDYCGDLAYLDEDPDMVASIDAEWTAAYWQSTLAQPPARPSTAALRGLPGRTEPPRGNASPNTDGGEEEFSSLFRRHKATVVAQQASSLYVLLPRAADAVVVGDVLQRMRDHAHQHYAGYRHVFAEYEKLYKWALYKERVLCDVSKKAPVSFR